MSKNSVIIDSKTVIVMFLYLSLLSVYALLFVYDTKNTVSNKCKLRTCDTVPLFLHKYICSQWIHFFLLS